MRALITGIGAISCLGRGLEVHRKAFSSGQSGLSPVERHWPGKALQSWVGLVSARKGARLNAEDMLCDAIGMALQESGLSGLGDLPVFAGSVHGEIGRWQRLRRAGDPGSAARAQWDFDLSRLDAVRKPIVISTACTASSVAIGEALRCLASGKSEIAIAAGTEVVSDFLYHGFESLRALAAGRCRPFDRDRDGLNLGEGAGAIVLETAASAQRRNRQPFAEVAGFGFGTDAMHLTAPDQRGGGSERAIRAAFAAAELPVELDTGDVINTHGTGTSPNDRMEMAVIRRLFADKGMQPAVAATKSLTGHMCGAAGVIETIGSVCALLDDAVPHIAGMTTPDSAGKGCDFVAGKPRELTVQRVLSLNSGFGGTNSALLLQKVA